MNKNELEIIVDGYIIQVKNFVDCGECKNFFAVGCNGNLYTMENKEYKLTEKHIFNKTTPKADVFGIIRYDRQVEE